MEQDSRRKCPAALHAPGCGFSWGVKSNRRCARESGCGGVGGGAYSMYLYLLGILLAQIQGNLELRLLVNLHSRRRLKSSSKD